MKVHALKVEKSRAVIPQGNVQLTGDLAIPAGAAGLAIFAHGSGSSRHSPRNQAVARYLNEHDIGTLMFDLLTESEEAEELYTRHLRFNIPLLAERLVAASRWTERQEIARDLPLGYFGSSTGAAAALVAATKLGDKVRAVVSRGGRPDLAGELLSRAKAPTLLIVGGDDEVVIELNEQAREKMRCTSELVIVPHADHLFEEVGTLEKVAELAAEFFLKQFQSPPG